MEFIEALIKLIVDNGIGVACVIYIMYFNSTTMKEITNTLVEVQKQLVAIDAKLDKKSTKKKDDE